MLNDEPQHASSRVGVPDVVNAPGQLGNNGEWDLCHGGRLRTCDGGNGWREEGLLRRQGSRENHGRGRGRCEKLILDEGLEDEDRI